MTTLYLFVTERTKNQKKKTFDELYQMIFKFKSAIGFENQF